MSQQEFENYLSLLGKLLRLSPRRREQVADEFRDHLEARQEYLLNQGLSREAAVRQALDEFGDAAVLATSLVSISRNRRKRWVMKVSMLGVLGAAAAILLAISLWPENPRLPLTERATAQGGAKEAPAKESPAEAPGATQEPKLNPAPASGWDAKLAKKVDVAFQDTPLKDVFEQLAKENDVQVYFNRKALEDASIALDTPISLTLKAVRLETVIELVLEQMGDALAHADRDGILVISSKDSLNAANVVKVYNCRDMLLAASDDQSPALGFGGGGAGGMMPHGIPRGGKGDSGGGMFSVPNLAAGAAAPGGLQMAPPPGAGSRAMAGGMAAAAPVSQTPEEARAQRLMNLLTTTVQPETWTEAGGTGSIAEFEGLIVVRQSAKIHKEVEKVLTMLREAAGKPAPASDKEAKKEAGGQPLAPPLSPPPVAR